MTMLTQPLPEPAADAAGKSSGRAGSAVEEILFPLTDLLDGAAPKLVQVLEGDGDPMPEPYRQLLVHGRDMTSTLERFHREIPCLDPLSRRRESSELRREVLLRGERTGRILEYGAIRIILGRFETDARWAILEGRRPLGAILADYRVEYESRPRRFFSIESTPHLESHLGLAQPTLLYGRQNVLVGEAGTLAEVVEILPPFGSPVRSREGA